jgi:hypothetical protein
MLYVVQQGADIFSRLLFETTKNKVAVKHHLIHGNNMFAWTFFSTYYFTFLETSSTFNAQ